MEDLKVSLFAGPVFRDDDRNFINVKLPREFWKVIVFVEDGILKAKAFLLAQNLDQLRAFELDAFKVYQLALTEVEERCGLIFPDALKGADSVGRRLKSLREVVSERKPLASLKDIDWS